MKNLKERSKFWSDPEKLSRPNLKWYDDKTLEAFNDFKIFKDKKVLEIGMGLGEQFKKISPFAKEYHIADISESNLNNPIFDKCTKFLIKSWKLDTHNKYDIITFWYVVHHSYKEELRPFINFLMKHLKKEGLLIFNSPLEHRHSTRFYEDGIRTTLWLKGEVKSIFQEKPLELIFHSEFEGNEVFIMKKL